MGTVYLSSIIYICNALSSSNYSYLESVMPINKIITIANNFSIKSESLNSSIIPEIPPEMKSPVPGAPMGYGPVKNSSPKARKKALEILRKIKKQEITFGYLEKFSDVIDGKRFEYIAKVEAHYDNHPKLKQEPNADSYWHIGVSIYEKN